MNPPITRRAFLSSAAFAALSVAGCAKDQPARSIPEQGGIIDTHTHFYDPTRPQGVPWPGRDDTVLYRPVYPEEFERLARPLGVTTTVVVEASAWVEDNAWVLELAHKNHALVGLVGNLKPGDPGFVAGLRRFGSNPRFRGIRIGGDDVIRAASDSAVRADLERLAQADLAVDVLIGPDQLAAVADLAGIIPDLRVVIDHCANVRVDGKSPPVAWREGIQKCAARPNVVMKVSGLVEGTGRAQGDAPRDLAYYQPTLDLIWDAFGPRRVMYGSNWPVSARFATYETVFRIVEAYFRSKGSKAAAQYFTSNAKRVYKPVLYRG